MNTQLLGATFVVIAALVGTPILAEAITELNAVKVTMDNAGNYQGIVFKTLDVVPIDGTVIGGYAILTENADFIAVTSHRGAIDSEAQFDADDPIWHTHLVKASENDSCVVAGIDALSFEEPSAKVLVREGSNSILVKAIANGTSTYFDVLSDKELEFTVGDPIQIQGAAEGFVESISFDLNVAEDGTICIADIEKEADEGLPDPKKDPKKDLT